MINYIIACYFGNRRNVLDKTSSDPFYYIKRHIENLNNFNDPKIKKITFMVNPNSNEDYKIYEIIKNLKIESEVIFRQKNEDFSYGCWHDAILKNLNNDLFEYFFIIEDDYMPCINNFSSYFLEQFTENTAAVFQDYSTSEHGLHARFSNGIIKKESCRAVFDKYQKIFELKNNSINYSEAEFNQINFTNLFKQMNYEIKDISKISKNKFFFIVPERKIVPIGNIEGIDIIEPIT